MLKHESSKSHRAAQGNKSTALTPPLKVLEVFGRRIKEERKKRNITQEQIAEYVGVSDDTVKRIESGCCAKLDVAFNIAECLCVPISSLLPPQDIPGENVEEKLETIENALQVILEKIG